MQEGNEHERRQHLGALTKDHSKLQLVFSMTRTCPCIVVSVELICGCDMENQTQGKRAKNCFLFSCYCAWQSSVCERINQCLNQCEVLCRDQ